jgi:D-lactate dehydrogenase
LLVSFPQQNHKCGHCGLKMLNDEKVHLHHIDGNHKNGKITDELFLKLRSYPNVLITGHQAFLTNEALEGIAFKTIENMDAWQLNGSCVNEL